MLQLAPVAQLLHQVLDAAHTVGLRVLPLTLFAWVCLLLLPLPLLPLILLHVPMYAWVRLLLLSLPLLRLCRPDCVSPWLPPIHLLLLVYGAAAAACLVH
jgi:hypothetical protein